MADWEPDIFAYVNFRDYLRDYYEAGKEHTQAISYRYLARKAGFASPNFLKLVIDGERNVGPESVDKIADALGLEDDERRFFADLVAFDQAEEVEERNAAFERIAARRRFQQARRIDRSMFEYLSHWYYPAIRELAAHPEFRDDPSWIAERLTPSVDEEAVAEALDLLLEMGLLVRGDDGDISRGEPSLTTGHEVGSLAIGNFHRQMLERAAESIESFGSSERDVSGLTVCIDPELTGELKERIHSFRETLLHLCEESDRSTTVYQINMQLFPLTDPETNGETNE